MTPTMSATATTQPMAMAAMSPVGGVSSMAYNAARAAEEVVHCRSMVEQARDRVKVLKTQLQHAQGKGYAGPPCCFGLLLLINQTESNIILCADMPDDTESSKSASLRGFLSTFLESRPHLLDKDKDLPYRRACRATRINMESLLARSRAIRNSNVSESRSSTDGGGNTHGGAFDGAAETVESSALNPSHQAVSRGLDSSVASHPHTSNSRVFT